METMESRAAVIAAALGVEQKALLEWQASDGARFMAGQELWALKEEIRASFNFPSKMDESIEEEILRCPEEFREGLSRAWRQWKQTMKQSIDCLDAFGCAQTQIDPLLGWSSREQRLSTLSGMLSHCSEGVAAAIVERASDICKESVREILSL